MPIADISARLPQLERMARDGAEPALIAEEVAQVWMRVDAALRPIVGAKGVMALYGRSRQLAARQRPWLGTDEAASANWKLMDLSALRAQVAAQSAQEAVHASLAHLEQFDRLLGALIGEALKDQLLAPAWLAPVAGPGHPGPPQALEA